MGRWRGAHGALENQVKRNEFSSGGTGKPLEAWMEGSWWEWHFGKSIWAVRCRCLFCLFLYHRCFKFWCSPIYHFLVTCNFDVIPKKPLSNPKSGKNLFLFSSKSLIAITLSFRSMIHFDFIFTYGVRWGFTFILLHVEYSCVSTICYKEYSLSI